MEIGDAFRSRIEGRIGEAIEKYFDGGFSGHVTVIRSGSRFSADCMICLDTGMALQATADGQEPIRHSMSPPNASKSVCGVTSVGSGLIMPGRQRFGAGPTSPKGVAPMADDEEVPENYAPAIVAESTIRLKTCRWRRPSSNSIPRTARLCFSQCRQRPGQHRLPSL